MAVMRTVDLQQKLTDLQATLRPGQRELANWQGGPLAVSAVPGAGKSYGMAVGAAIALATHDLKRDCQLILVTFTRSAASNLKHQVRQHLRNLTLPLSGFMVQTLHGLALSIASRHPQLSGMRLDQMTLVSPNRRHYLLRRAVDVWVAEHPYLYQQLIEQGSFDGEETERLRRQSVLRSEVLPALAEIAVREAKSSGLSAGALAGVSEHLRDELPVLAIATGLYRHYQALLDTQHRIDYDDMILAALRVLDDHQARAFWQQQVFAVFEDEAQDSTPLQTRLLELLAATPTGPPNLVRVGDPNQAINSTFTPADPLFFRQFCQARAQEGRRTTMNQAGRSTAVIMAAANQMLSWVNASGLAGAETPFLEQTIAPVPQRDPQANANPDPAGYGLVLTRPPDIYRSIEKLGHRVVSLLHTHPDHNAAILVRENKQGRFIADVLSDPKRYGLSVNLEAQGVEIFDVGGRDRRSHVPAEMLALLQFLSQPHSPNFLKAALTIFVNRQLIPPQPLDRLASQPEQFLYPTPLDPVPGGAMALAQTFCRKLLHARWELPHHQLIPFLGLSLQYDPAELATAHKLTGRLMQQTEGQSSMAVTLPALQEIVSAERFDPVDPSEIASDFSRDGEDTQDKPRNPYLRPQQLTIITMHKAKGLDWDYVFLPFLHADSIPGKAWVPTAAQFLGDFTLSEVARAQIRAHVHGQYPLPSIEEAWQQARDLKTAEEFRLLYVAMTRAKRLLWMSAAAKAPFSWNTFDWQRQDTLQSQQPCPVLKPLQQKFPLAVDGG